ncbi:MAG TPA: hypothetical protein EYH08_04255 [Pyrodictium sp.]|nr:hypothetical protein [Pyrodictium sp.]
MRPKIVVVFYHPKDPANVEDMKRIVEDFGGDLLIIPRKGVLEDHPNAVSFEEAVSRIRSCEKILLETYGFNRLDEIDLECSRCIAIIVGAEDYGVPQTVGEKFSPDVVARIPMAVEGMSYNVVSTVVMALAEIVYKCRST